MCTARGEQAGRFCSRLALKAGPAPAPHARVRRGSAPWLCKTCEWTPRWACAARVSAALSQEHARGRSDAMPAPLLRCIPRPLVKRNVSLSRSPCTPEGFRLEADKSRLVRNGWQTPRGTTASATAAPGSVRALSRRTNPPLASHFACAALLAPEWETGGAPHRPSPPAPSPPRLLATTRPRVHRAATLSPRVTRLISQTPTVFAGPKAASQLVLPLYAFDVRI